MERLNLIRLKLWYVKRIELLYTKRNQGNQVVTKLEMGIKNKRMYVDSNMYRYVGMQKDDEDGFNEPMGCYNRLETY